MRASVLSVNRRAAMNRMEDARKRSHRVANRGRAPCEIKIGEKVYWRDPRKGMNVASKLSKAFKGPFKVVKVLGNGTVIISEREKGKGRKVAID